jgi:aldehyde dehydrogenase (NAD+)
MYGKTPSEAFELTRNGQKSLSLIDPKTRTSIIKQLKLKILDEREMIIDRIQQDTGKSRSDALVSEIFGVLDHLAYLEKNGAKLIRDRKVHTPIALMGKRSRIFFEPMGTILIISPWNYPFYQAIVPITAAFICGNTVVYKPSEHTPLTGLIEKILSKSGFKEEWVQIVYGDGKVGSALIDQKPDKIFFTGSERTGRVIMKQASEHLIPLELELGGKDPMIVFDDVNIQRAAAGALWGGITNLGQSCTSVERIYVQSSVYDDFKKELVRITAAIKQETDNDGDADVGLMTTDFQAKTVNKHLSDAKDKKAELFINKGTGQDPKAIFPEIIDNVPADSLLLTEETFGPVLPLIPFETEDEAIQMANDSPYGLSASVWSKDMKRAERVARAIKTGNVSINNVMLTEGNAALPFGGIKNSGFGRFKGEIGLHSFCNIKSVLIDKDGSKIESNWFPYTKEKYALFSKMTVNLFEGGMINFIKFMFSGLKLEAYSNKVGKKGRGAGQ